MNDVLEVSEPRRVSSARLKQLLYLICGLTDFAAFVVVFAVSRGLAELHAEAWYLGCVGAGLSFSAGIGSIMGGWLAHRLDGRKVFVTGSLIVCLTTALCGLGDIRSAWYLPGYWFLGIGLGFIYPPLVGWLNQGEDAHANHRGVSRTLILYCVAWNVGMMCGQLAGGTLFAWGTAWTFGAAVAVSLVIIGLSVMAVRLVRPITAGTETRTAEQHHAVELATAFKKLSWIANLGGMFGGSMVIHLLPDLAVSIGVPAENHGVLLASWRAVIIGTYLLMHNFMFWHYRFSTSLASQILAAVGLVVISQADSANMLLVGLALLGQLVGYNYFSGLYYSTAGSAHEKRALAAGIHEATLAAGMAVGTMAGGLLGSIAGQGAPYVLAAVVIVAMIGVQILAWRTWIVPLRRDMHASYSKSML